MISPSSMSLIFYSILETVMNAMIRTVPCSLYFKNLDYCLYFPFFVLLEVLYLSLWQEDYLSLL